jgi:HSP20 family molecular chaperone IbpA
MALLNRPLGSGSGLSPWSEDLFAPLANIFQGGGRGGFPGAGGLLQELLPDSNRRSIAMDVTENDTSYDLIADLPGKF